MKFIEPRKIFRPISPVLNLQRQISITGQNLVFPFYHAVNNNPGAHLRNLYRIKTEKEFERDLDKMLRYFDPLSPGILCGKQSYNAERPGFILSFDDGLREVYEIICPKLISKGIPSLFFLNNNFIDNKDLFYRYKASLIIEKLENKKIANAVEKEIKKLLPGSRYMISLNERVLSLGYNQTPLLNKICDLLEIDVNEYLKTHRPYMEEAEVAELKKQGFYLGGHSFDHPGFVNLKPDKQLEEVIHSTDDIVGRFHLDHSFFAFPFTDSGVSAGLFSDIYKSQGGILDASFGTAGLKNEKKYPHYQRISMEKLAGDSEKILNIEFFYYRMKRFAGKGN